MTNMRDQIEDIIWGNCHNGDNGGSCDRATDAILEALPNMIAPLVWESFSAACRSEKTSTGSQYIMTESRSGSSVCVTFLNQGNSHTIGYFPYWNRAEAAANTHHRAAIMAAFTLGAT